MQISRWLGACALTFVMSGCNAGQGLAFLPDGPANLFGSPRMQALVKAQMADGAVTLVPPTGFCIDRSSLSTTFALMARCDTLGAGRNRSGAKLAIMTATFVRIEQPTGQFSSADMAAALAPAQILATQDRDGVALVNVKGAPVDAGFNPDHWRASTTLNQVLISTAYYAPETQAADPELLRALISEIRRNTNPLPAEQSHTQKRKNPISLIAGLFE